MKFSKEEILRSIIESKILDHYLEQHSELREMIEDSENSDIHYGEEFVPTIYQREVFEQRANIRLIEDADELSKSNATAFQSVLIFIKKYPENNIFNVTLNSSDAHFSVWCGLIDANIETLCVMQGGHIPEYAFKESKK